MVHRSFLVLAIVFGNVAAQSANCATLAGGCSAGNTHDGALRGAAARFDSNLVYGSGSEAVVFSSFLDGSSLGQVSYSCSDGSDPPAVGGSTISSLVQQILSCPNQCGSIPLPGNPKCGVGVLVVEGADSMPCFAKAINALPGGVLPAAKPSSGAFTYLGCYTDSPGARVLTSGSVTAVNMTVDECVRLARGFKYAGVEFGAECYWGNTIESSPRSAASDCTMPCAGEPVSACGAGNRVGIYFNTAFGVSVPPSSTMSSPTTSPTIPPVAGWVSSVGSYQNPMCYVDSPGSRVLRAGSSSDPSMTVEKCVAFAKQGSWRYAGVEFGVECYVGNTLRSDSASPPDNCKMPCSGDVAEICGDGNRVLIYTDQSWSDPTAADMLAVMERFNETLAQAPTAITEYKHSLELVQAIYAAGGHTRKRQDPQGQSTAIELSYMGESALRARSVGQDVDVVVNDVETLTKKARAMDLDRPGGSVVPDDVFSDIYAVSDSARSSLEDVRTASQETLDSISSSTPLIFDRWITASSNSLSRVGIPAHFSGNALLLTGVFLALAKVIIFFGGSLPTGPDGLPGGLPPDQSTTLTLTPTPIPSMTTSTSDISEITATKSTSTSSSASSTPTICLFCDCDLKSYARMPDLPHDGSLEDDMLGMVDDDFDDYPRNPASANSPGGVLLDWTPESGIFPHVLNRRSLVTIPNATAHTLRDEGQWLGKRYDACSLSYENDNYPSTARYGNTVTPQHADNNDQITKWVDYGLVSSGNPGICFWKIIKRGSRQGTQEYATEHVYEKHMISSYLRWLVDTDRQRRQKVVLVPPVATCPQLNNIFGSRSPTPNSPFANQTPLQALALALSDRTRVDEFFILNVDINAMKTVIMSYTLDTKTIPSLALSLEWTDVLQKMRYVSLVFMYMRADVVSDVFLETNTRMRNILAQVDADPYYRTTFGGPLVQIIDGETHQFSGWLAAYDVWLSQWLRLKEFKMQKWIQAAVIRILAGIAADTNLTGVQKTAWATFILAMYKDGQGGLLNSEAISFGAPYAGVMA